MKMDFLNKMEVTPELVREQVLDTIQNCCLCGTKLDFFHHVDYNHLKVKEDSRCPACGIRNKTHFHTLN